jgi:hypothetical protein
MKNKTLQIIKVKSFKFRCLLKNEKSDKVLLLLLMFDEGTFVVSFLLIEVVSGDIVVVVV